MCAAAQLHPDALDSLQPGRILASAYRLTRPLGSGGSGRVWEAEQLRLGGRVAIKFLDASLLEDEVARTRFEREARAVCEVRSPYIVQVQDHGVDGDVPFLVMEMLEGEDLGQLLERERALELAETAEIVGQLCRALDKAHRAGYVHRDVKPENVFVIEESDGSRFIKLLDFGFVKQLGAQTLTVTRDPQIGTPHYSSPEQLARPTAVDARSDTWAVGVTAYRMLAGRLPFGASADGDVTELYESILQGRYLPLTELRPELPKELDDWFAQMLAVAPEGRFATLRAASSALGSISRARTLDVKSHTRTRAGALPPTAAAKSRRWLVPALLLFVCACLGVGVWIWAGRGEPARRAQPNAAVSSKPSPTAPAPSKPAAAEPAPPPAAAPVALPEAPPPSPPAPTEAARARAPRKAAAVSGGQPPTHQERRANDLPNEPLPKDRGF